MLGVRRFLSCLIRTLVVYCAVELWNTRRVDCFSLLARERIAGAGRTWHPRRNFSGFATAALYAASPSESSSSARNDRNNGKDNDENNRIPTGNPLIRWLAQLSLEDYQWRSDYFKSTQADRMVEQSLARMRGENATYLRPMDAPGDDETLGPLGRWERDSVTWLLQVIDEEGQRARKIVESAGKLVRPSENKLMYDDDQQNLGPLGNLEKNVVQFFAEIKRAETERARTKTLRPKDIEEPFRGPLGTLESKAVGMWEEIRASERLRAQQSKFRGGEVVRPIDIPGPLGELELKVAEIFQAEKRRAKERGKNQNELVRPKDALYKGPLGTAENIAVETMQSLSREELERLRNIRRVMQENRPNPNSVLGNIEALMVGILRGPQLLLSVWERVQELLKSEVLEETDKEVLRKQQGKKKKKRKGDRQGQE